MVKSFKCMAAQLLNLFCLNPTPMTDRQTRDRQKWAKLVKAVLVGSVELWMKIFVRMDGRTAGNRFQLRTVARVAMSAHCLVTSVVL